MESAFAWFALGLIISHLYRGKEERPPTTVQFITNTHTDTPIPRDEDDGDDAWKKRGYSNN